MASPDVETEERFVFPPGPRGFAAACAALPVAIAVVVLLPYLDARMLAILVGVGAVFLLGTIFVAPVWWAPRTATLTEGGIAVGKRFMKWEELTEVRKGLFRCTPFALVRAARPRRLVLLTHPVVLRELLPAILRRRPEVTVSKHARRALANPESATWAPRWVGLLLLAAAAAAAAVPVLVRYGHLWTLIPTACAVLPFWLVACFASPPGATGELRFVQDALFPGGFIVLSFTMSLGVYDVPFFAIDASVAPVAVLHLAAGLVVLGRAKLRRLLKALIVACAIGLPLLIHQLGPRDALARTDITELFGGERVLPPLFWSEDGALAASSLPDGSRGWRQTVADLARHRSVPLPGHDSSLWMMWLDRSCACRAVREQDQWGLYLFRFDDGRDVRLSTVKYPTIPRLRHMSPDGRRLCWLAPSEEDQPPLIKTYDLKADRVEELEIKWPAGEHIAWGECGWADRETLVIQGHSPGPGAQPEPGQAEAAQAERDRAQALHVLWVSYEDRTVQHAVSPRRFSGWRISADGRYAFATGPEGDVPAGVHFLDLRTGRMVNIGGEKFPAWAPDGRVAVRVSGSHGREQWLCRFDAGKAIETPVLKIPEGEELVAASPRGRFAILRDRDRYRLRPLSLVNVATGQRLPLPTAVVSGLLLWLGWQGVPRLCPWESTFSLDGGKFVLLSFTPRTRFGLQLYSIPEEWLK